MNFVFNNKKDVINSIKANKIMTYSDVEKRHGIKIKGCPFGIRVVENSIILFSSVKKTNKLTFETKNGYMNKKFYYCGEKLKGTIDTFRNNNLKHEHIDYRPLYIYVRFGPDEYYYQGCFWVEEYFIDDENNIYFQLIEKEQLNMFEENGSSNLYLRKSRGPGVMYRCITKNVIEIMINNNLCTITYEEDTDKISHETKIINQKNYQDLVYFLNDNYSFLSTKYGEDNSFHGASIIYEYKFRGKELNKGILWKINGCMFVGDDNKVSKLTSDLNKILDNIVKQ